MREAVIVSTARTPLAKSHRGEFNQTPGAQLGAFSVQAAVQRAGIDPGLIEDLIWGCGYPEGTTGRNIGRQTALRAGLPVTVGGTVINRFCSSGLQAIAVAAGRIVLEGVPAMVAGGVESISLMNPAGRSGAIAAPPSSPPGRLGSTQRGDSAEVQNTACWVHYRCAKQQCRAVQSMQSRSTGFLAGVSEAVAVVCVGCPAGR